MSTLTIDKPINKGVPITFMGTTDEHNYVSINRLPDIDSDCVFQVENDMLIDDMKVKDRIVNHELFSETEPDSSIQEIGDRWWKEELIDNVYAGITGDGEIVYPNGSLVPIKGIVQNVSDLDNIDEYGYLVDAMLAKELKNDVNTLKKTVKELNSKLKILKTKYIVVNSFESSSILYSDIDFGKECAGCYIVGTILAVNQTPWTSSNWAMFRGCKLDENGRGRIYCSGSSFVNGHSLGCFVMAAK